MDSSGSIGKPDYKREKQFVKDLTNVFQISPNATRVSTIIYSDYPKLIFDFDTYSDKQSINTAHDNLEYLGNKTRIDKALNLTLTVFSRSRPSVPRIAFVLTDGEQTDENDAKPLDVAVRPLHDLGVQVYVIGIGSYIKREELYLMARRRQDVFFVSSFENLLRQTYRIVNQIDTVQGKYEYVILMTSRNDDSNCNENVKNLYIQWKKKHHDFSIRKNDMKSSNLNSCGER